MNSSRIRSAPFKSPLRSSWVATISSRGLSSVIAGAEAGVSANAARISSSRHNTRIDSPRERKKGRRRRNQWVPRDGGLRSSGQPAFSSARKFHFFGRAFRKHGQAVLDTQPFNLAVPQLRAISDKRAPGRMQRIQLAPGGGL